MTHTLFVVLQADGTLKTRRRGQVPAFRHLGTAKAWAKNPGDSVVRLDIPLDRAPVFIRAITL